MVDIFDEVDEDLRADRARALLKQYGGVLVAAAVVMVAAAGGWQAWRWYDARRTAELADSYLSAMKISDQKGAAKQAAEADFAAVADKAGSGYRSLALLQEAALKADAGDLTGASAIWDRVAADGSADSLIRYLADLQWCLHHVDNGDPAAVEARLKPLTSAVNPWHALATEALAMLDLRRGRTDAARDGLKALVQDASAPSGVRERAEGLLTRLGG